MKKNIPLAIAYDFDGTLAPGNMQEHSFIPELGISKEEFWQESRSVYALDKDMDEILAYMYLLMSKAAPNGGITRAVLKKHANDLTFFPGVEEWFLVPLFIIDEAVEKIKEGTVINYSYDASKSKITGHKAAN